MTNKLERKYLNLEIKAMNPDDEKGEFTGYAAYFGNVDHSGDCIERGAFNRCLREKRLKDIKILAQHDHREIVGVPLEIYEDEMGLVLKAKLLVDSNVPMADKYHALMKAGVLSGLSVGINILKREIDDEKGVRRLLECDLMEVSCVTWGANDMAEISTVKANSLTAREWETKLREVVGLPRSDAKKGANALARAFDIDSSDLREVDEDKANTDFENLRAETRKTLDVLKSA